MTKEEVISDFIFNLTGGEVTTIFDSTYGCYYDIKADEININLKEEEENPAASSFYRHLHDFHKVNDVTIVQKITWTVLHEIGHFFNQDEIMHPTNEDLIARTEIFLAKNINRYIQDLYYNISAEWAATEWAIDFIKNNFALVKLFEENLLTAE